MFHHCFCPRFPPFSRLPFFDFSLSRYVSDSVTVSASFRRFLGINLHLNPHSGRELFRRVYSLFSFFVALLSLRQNSRKSYLAFSWLLTFFWGARLVFASLEDGYTLFRSARCEACFVLVGYSQASVLWDLCDLFCPSLCCRPRFTFLGGGLVVAPSSCRLSLGLGSCLFLSWVVGCPSPGSSSRLLM